MQMGALVDYLLEYPDMTIREFFGMDYEITSKRKSWGTTTNGIL